MNWNDAIQQLAETHWKPRKPIAGYRFFSCNECGTHWSEKSRDCSSPSGDICPKCGEINHPNNFEEHPEWSVDKSGNLV